jgi:hypothetical protein
MRRRELIRILGTAAAAARAQQAGKVWRIGILSPASSSRQGENLNRTSVPVI